MNSIKVWLLLSINLLVLAVIAVISIFFYRQFQQAIDERVLLQLTSIMNLKRVQVEEYLNAENNTLQYYPTYLGGQLNPTLFDKLDTLCLKENLPGLYDFSHCSKDGEPLLGRIRQPLDTLEIIVYDQDRIQDILLERTGMGETGETYLVGDDKKLRSASRFFPGQNPLTIFADTEGVRKALEGNSGRGIILDYRGIAVYSAYHRLNVSGIDWVILSEIDVAEAALPLANMRQKLILITLFVSLFAVILTLLITKVLTGPLYKMRDLLRSMSAGRYDLTHESGYNAKEIKEMFKALDQLKQSISEAIRFSSDIGNMNLTSQYTLTSKHDELGKSLIQMREKLAEYERKEKASQQFAKRSLITGQENERKRLSRELHDGMGPLLTSLKLTIQSMGLEGEKGKNIKDILDQTISEIRRMTYDLMPPALTDFGVGRAMTHFIELIRQSSGLDIHYEDATRIEESKISADMNICLYRVCQELIHNTLKHAEATRIALTITEFDDKVSLFYFDDGHGFEEQKVTKGAGLKNIRERIAVFDGYLHITSSNDGTEVEIELPL